MSLLTLFVVGFPRLNVIELGPWTVSRDELTAGSEDRYEYDRSEAWSATMRSACYLYSFSRTTLTA